MLTCVVCANDATTTKRTRAQKASSVTKDADKSDLIQKLAFESTRSAKSAIDNLATAANIIDGEMAERMLAENNKLAAMKAVQLAPVYVLVTDFAFVVCLSLGRRSRSSWRRYLSWQSSLYSMA